MFGLCVFLVGHPLRGRFASTRPLRYAKGRLFRSIAASFGFARAKLVILFSYKIQRRRCRQTIGRPGGFW